MFNVYLSIFIIILGFATVSNLWRIFIWTIPFSHQESYLETNWILPMCDVIELLHCRVCTTRDDSCWSCVKLVCVIELFLLERRFNSKKNSNYSSSEIDKWLHNYVTNFNCRWQQCRALESKTEKIQKTISLIREWIRKLQRLLISMMTS